MLVRKAAVSGLVGLAGWAERAGWVASLTGWLAALVDEIAFWRSFVDLIVAYLARLAGCIARLSAMVLGWPGLLANSLVVFSRLGLSSIGWTALVAWHGWLVGCLVARLAGWDWLGLAGCVASWLAGWLFGWLAG